jgi:hypothetical protein
MITIAKIRAWLQDAEQAAVADVHEFVDFIEGKSAIEDAVALLEQNGYTVTPPPVASVASPA